MTGSEPDDTSHAAAPEMLEPDAVGAMPGRARAGEGDPSRAGRLRSGKLAGLSMGAAIWVLSWPILLESLLNSTVGLTDTLLAAAIDDGGAAADAIGGASYVLWFVGLIVAALGVGATAMVSRGVGAGRLAVARAVVGQTMLLAIASGVAVGIGIALLAPTIAALLGLKGASATAFLEYMRINALGVLCNTLLFAGIACLRGAGDSIRPLTAMVVANLVNLAVSYALSGVDLAASRLVDGEVRRVVLLENPFSFDMGVRGIAWGTVIAQGAGAALVLWFLIRGVAGVKLSAARLRPHTHTVMRLLRLGWPNFLETLGMWVGNFLVVMMVGWLGAESLARTAGSGGGAAAGGYLGAHIVAIRIEAFSFLPGFAMGAAAATLAGQFLGAGLVDQARRAVWLCTWIAMGVMGLGGVVFLCVPQTITGLVTSQPVHLQTVPTLLMICGAVQIPFAMSIVLRSALRGVGDVRAAMWLTWVTTFGVRLPLAYLLSGVSIPLPWGGVVPPPMPGLFESPLAGLWVGLCVEIVVRALVFWWRFGSDRWESRRI